MWTTAYRRSIQKKKKAVKKPAKRNGKQKKKLVKKKKGNQSVVEDSDDELENADEEPEAVDEEEEPETTTQAQYSELFEKPDEVRAFPGLATEASRMSQELIAIAEDPMALLMFFMPPQLWKHVAKESNRYRRQQIDNRVAKVMMLQEKRRQTDTDFAVESDTEVRARMLREKDMDACEVLRLIGLLVARTLCPHRRRMKYHWSVVSDGAIPMGTFGKFMSRNRFESILRDLHFSDNDAPSVRFDKLVKIRPIVEMMQPRFLRGWHLPPVLSFDEGVLPATSRMNSTRQFMPDKPHRYGSKMFLTCDPRTAYCYRYVPFSFFISFYMW